MENKEIISLLKKYNKGICTAKERALLESWYIERDFEAVKEITDIEFLDDLRSIGRGLPLYYPAPEYQKLWPSIAVAVAIIMVIGAGFFFFYKNTTIQVNQYTNDIAAGSNKAYLILANGKRIALNDTTNGVLARQTGVKITKNTAGQLIYTISDQNSAINEYNTIETPKGGQTQVCLSDHTVVWLNAASRLKYPTSFAKHKERSVELAGEAYFEVAKDKLHPFKVKSINQEVEVLGTHFNINSYTDESCIKTTLLEGSIRLNGNTVLKPGEQASLTRAGNILVEKTNVNKTVAWKDGKFVFTSENIKSIMRTLARWYDIEVIYQGNFNDKIFTGSISRYDSISKILNKITFTEAVHFKIEGRRVTVME